MKKIIILLCILLTSCGKTPNEETIPTPQKTEKSKIILALGDSLTAWYGLDMNASYPAQLESMLQKNGYNYKVINGGISGDTSKWVLERIGLYETLDIELVLLVIGWNDGLRGQDTKNMEQNISKSVQIFKQQWTKIVLWGMDIPMNLWMSYRKNFKNVYKNIAKKHDIHLIDFFLEWVAWVEELNLPDRIHPNKQWYKIVVDNVYNFLIYHKLISQWSA